VRRRVKSQNERNPCPLLPFPERGGTLRGLPAKSRRKEGTTSSPHGPYARGYTSATMARTKGCKAVRLSKSHKPGPSSDRGLQPDPVKPEWLVIADQLRRGEYVPGSCTHRPSRHGSHLHRKSPKGTNVWVATGAKS
jgi:hypothetical protein